ncbi:MAG TPA: hypothetical protein VN857_03760 [Chthoniobacterales bacterium]|jgi:hypothetical protein|nr:hypothetical protein [Chthoniobacterales bacterium]
METNQHMYSICSTLDELALPRAFLERELDKFVAWNSRFLKALSISEEELRAINASEILSIQEEGTEMNGGFRMIPCSSVSARGEARVGGHVITTQGALTFVMLDVGTASGQVSQISLEAAVRKEQNRLYRFLHDRMSPNLMAVAFLAESLAGRSQVGPGQADRR